MLTNLDITRSQVCAEVQHIMGVYRQQEAEGNIGTPGGLEHMGDVWKLLGRWDAMLAEAANG